MVTKFKRNVIAFWITLFFFVLAIPAYIFYKILLGHVDRLVVEMEERSLRVVELVAEAPEKGDDA